MPWRVLKSLYLAVFIAAIVSSTACSQGPESVPVSPTAVMTAGTEAYPVIKLPEVEPTIPPNNTAVPEPELEESTIESEPPTVEEPIVEEVPEETVEPLTEAIDVTYFTPAQQEGPYYTVDKPQDRDNDLVEFQGADGEPQGQVLEFGGKVYDANGLPVEGLVIEIWQTDESGVYLHPNDPDTASRDPNFQFYGEAVTDATGGYSFRTILPGQYEPRPPHIHFKVELNGQELLTSQFYFAGETDLQGEEAALLITAVPGQDAGGNPILIGARDIILRQAISN